MSKSDQLSLGAERLRTIRTLLRAQKVMRIDDLCEALSVSPATVRRDLTELHSQGYIRRVHGGAVSLEGNLDEPLFDDKEQIAVEEKRRIARAAFPYIKPRDSIYLDAGSTVAELARLLGEMHQLTVVTNSLRVAHILSTGGPKVILTGGALRRLSQSFIGPLALPVVQQVNVDTAFMGSVGISFSKGLTTTDADEALVKRQAMAAAGMVILLAHSAKVESVSFAHFGNLDRIDLLITDSGLKPAARKHLEEQGTEVVTAS